MSKVNNLLNQIVKNNVWESTDLVGILFNTYEEELVEVVKDMNNYLANESADKYGVAHIMLTLHKLINAIHYYNDGIDGVFNTSQPVIDEVINVIKNTAKEATNLWTKITEKK